MKKNKRIFLIVIVILIIAIIFGIVKIVNKNSPKEQRLSKIYQDLEESQTYLFEIEKNNNNKTIMAKKGDKTIIDQYTKNSETNVENHTTTLVKDNNTYLILHDRKEYYVYTENNVEQTIVTDGLKEIISKSYTTGTEKIKGKKYSYEEYDGSSMFMISNLININDTNVKTRFYFDSKNNLAYIKTILDNKQELLKVTLEKDVKDSIFEIPSDYAEN
mgnify:FL=1